MSHLASNGEVEPAVQLAEALLTVRADPRASKNTREENEFFHPKALPYFEPWHYGKILEKNIPDLVAVAADQTLTLLCNLLDDAVRFSQTADKDQEPDDYSYIWRSLIDQPQHTVDDVRGLLVSAVLQAAEQNARNNPVNVREIVRYLESKGGAYFIGSHFTCCGYLRMLRRTLFPNGSKNRSVSIDLTFTVNTTSWQRHTSVALK